ncbi:hypothetical protein VTN96DRAFT_8573 [Rasamsonia emersonii]
MLNRLKSRRWAQSREVAHEMLDDRQHVDTPALACVNHHGIGIHPLHQIDNRLPVRLERVPRLPHDPHRRAMLVAQE